MSICMLSQKRVIVGPVKVLSISQDMRLVLSTMHQDFLCFVHGVYILKIETRTLKKVKKLVFIVMNVFVVIHILQ